MPFKSVDLFTCDRCRDETEKGRGEQPVNWATVYVISPPRKVLAENTITPTLLCAACRDQLHRWLGEAPARSVESVSA